VRRLLKGLLGLWLLMAAGSVDLPAVVVPGGPMLTGTFRGVPLGCGTDVWRLSEEVRAGTLTPEAFAQSESAMVRSRGHCNTMGTASTMALVAEALGTVVPGVAGTPAPDSRLLEAAHETGRLAVELVASGRRPDPKAAPRSFSEKLIARAPGFAAFSRSASVSTRSATSPGPQTTRGSSASAGSSTSRSSGAVTAESPPAKPMPVSSSSASTSGTSRRS